MSIAFRSAASSSSFGTGVVTINAPSGARSGDVLVAVLSVDPSATISPPSGWSSFSPKNSGTYRHQVFLKALTGAPPASYTFAVSQPASGVILAYSGVDPTPIYDDYRNQATTSSTVVTAPSVPVTGPNRRIVVVMGTSRGFATFTTPPGVTLRRTVSSSSSSVAVFDYTQIPDAATSVRGSTLDGAGDNVGAQLALVPKNTAPNAPTLTAPVGGVVRDRATAGRFTWTFSDPDPGDSQSKYDLRYRIVGTTTWTTLTEATPNPYRDVLGGTFAAGNYEWQVRTYDAQGLAGPYSTSAQFTAADAPGAPTITAPGAGSAITAATATVAWSYPTQSSYQVRVVADNAGVPDTSTVVADTGEVTDAATRAVMQAFPDNNVYRHVQVRVRDSASGLLSSWSSSRVFISYNGAAAPLIGLVVDPATASITVSLTNSTPGAAEDPAVSNDVYRSVVGDSAAAIRVATGVSVDGEWTDWTPAHNVDYAYQAVAVTAIGATSASDWRTVADHGEYPEIDLFPSPDIYPGA